MHLLALPPLKGSARREFILLGLTLAAVFLACYQPIWDPDTYWHLAVGRQMWQTGHLVRTETFSFTAPGAVWEDTEWLFHALAYPLWKIGGERALSLCTAILGMAGVGLAYRCVRLAGGGAMELSLYMLLMMGAYQSRIRFRPDLLSLVFMAILVEALLRWTPTPPRTGRIWIFLSALFCLWAQCHGGWAYGMALLGVVLAGAALDSIRDRTFSVRFMISLGLTGLAPAIALFVNPYTWQIPWFPVKSVIGFMDPTQIQIQEWDKTPFQGAFGIFILVCIAGSLAVLLTWKRLTWKECLWVGSQVFFGLHWVRYVAYSAVSLAPAFCGRLAGLLRRPALVRAAWGSALSLTLLAGLYHFGHLKSEMNLTQKYPVMENRFLEVNGIEGNLFNVYSCGGYLDWNAYPRNRIFMDGRYYPFVAAMQDYWQAQKSIAGYREFLEKYPFDVALYPFPDFHLREKGQAMDTPARGPSALVFPPKDWALVYIGNYGMVLLKREARYADVIAKHEYRVLRPDDLPYLVRAARKGEIDKAQLEEEIRRAIHEAPWGPMRPVLERALSWMEGGSGKVQ